MLKHSGSAARLGADSPDERGGWERTPESGEKFIQELFGSDMTDIKLVKAFTIPRQNNISIDGLRRKRLSSVLFFQ